MPGDGTSGNITVDIENMPLCNMMNVGQSVMQLALYMNPRRIYIVGCDLSEIILQQEIKQGKK